MSKIKNSKYRNTGLLLEFLIRQISLDLMEGIEDSKAVDIIKEHFRNNELSKELSLYSTLAEYSNLKPEKAHKLINTVLESSKKINRAKLRQDKYNLIKNIKKHYNEVDFFKANIPNYKVHASIYTLIENYNSPEYTNPEIIYNSTTTLIESLTKTTKVITEHNNEEKIEKFNFEFNDLLPNQKKLLKSYISDTKENNLKIVNENIKNIKKSINSKLINISDPATKIRLSEAYNILDKVEEVNDEVIISLMHYHQLVEDLNNI